MEKLSLFMTGKDSRKKISINLFLQWHDNCLKCFKIITLNACIAVLYYTRIGFTKLCELSWNRYLTNGLEQKLKLSIEKNSFWSFLIKISYRFNMAARLILSTGDINTVLFLNLFSLLQSFSNAVIVLLVVFKTQTVENKDKI